MTSSINLPRDLLLTREWLLALILLAATLIGIAILKRFLVRVQLKPQWNFVTELIPYILNLGYVIAINIFTQAAPLGPRGAVWAENFTYCLTVWAFLLLLQHSLLLISKWSTRRIGSSTTLQQGFIPLFRNLITVFVFSVGGIMVLKRFGYDVVSLLTALGVGSLAVGLAAKEALSNMISGFVIILDRNLRPGDRVNLGTLTGDVQEIGLRSTRISTGDGNTMIVPNFDLVNNRIMNYSMPSRASTCSTQIRVPFSADFEKVKDVCLKILAGIPKVDHGKSPWINLTSISDGYQLISIGWWVREMDDCPEVLTQFNRQLLSALKANQTALIEISEKVSGYFLGKS